MARASRSLTPTPSATRHERRQLALVPASIGETYYLDIYGGGLASRDEQGERLPDIQAARLQAILTATHLLRATLNRKGTGQTVTVVVRDEGGERYRVTICAG